MHLDQTHCRATYVLAGISKVLLGIINCPLLLLHHKLDRLHPAHVRGYIVAQIAWLTQGMITLPHADEKLLACALVPGNMVAGLHRKRAVSHAVSAITQMHVSCSTTCL
jgi:hypothetical protein